MPQNVVDDIKRNWANFRSGIGKQEPEHKGDYLAHDWKPPAGRQVPKPQEKAPERKKVARKR